MRRPREKQDELRKEIDTKQIETVGLRGFEPTRDYFQRILGKMERVPRSLTKLYEPVFTRLAVVEGSLRGASLSTRKATFLASS